MVHVFRQLLLQLLHPHIPQVHVRARAPADAAGRLHFDAAARAAPTADCARPIWSLRVLLRFVLLPVELLGGLLLLALELLLLLLLLPVCVRIIPRKLGL